MADDTTQTIDTPAGDELPFLKTTPGMLTAILAPALAGGLLSHGLVEQVPARPGEDPEERRRRILRNAAAGALMGAGAGAGGLAMYHGLPEPLPPPPGNTEATVRGLKTALGGAADFATSPAGVGGGVGAMIGGLLQHYGGKKARNKLLQAGRVAKGGLKGLGWGAGIALGLPLLNKLQGGETTE